MLKIMDYTIYKILLWALPVLLSLLAFIGAMAVKSLISLANNVNEINEKLAIVITKHDSLEKRVDKIELLNDNKKQYV